MNIDHALSAYALSLKAIDGVGNKKALNLMNAFPSIELFSKAETSDFSSVVGKKSGEDIAAIRSSLVNHWVKQSSKLIDGYQDDRIQVIAIGDEAYPQRLSDTLEPPLVIYVRGNIAALHQPRSVAIIGTRTPTRNGISQASELSEVLSRHGVVVVSGLAKGIDAAAHLGSIRAKSPGVSVFGTDLTTVYPKENKQLARDLLDQGGAVISEIGPGEKSGRGAFVRRDRIQAGLSDVIIPVQSDIDGGTMHTVKFGINYGRPVFVPMPSAPDMSASSVRGTQALVEDGRASNFQIDDPWGFWRGETTARSHPATKYDETHEQIKLDLWNTEGKI